MAAALLLAGWKRREEPYWGSWALANLVLGVALAVFVFESRLPPILTAMLPNGLLVLGFGLRWRAAREFGGRAVSPWLVWVPFAGFLIACVPLMQLGYGTVFSVVNVLLTVQACAIACEFWRDRADGLPSRYGLVAAYGLMGLSFAFRIPLGVIDVAAMPAALPYDNALTIHLVIAVVHSAASGAFAMSLAHERTNARLHHAAMHDALTGLANRGAFEVALHDALAGTPRGHFALALLDIDHFKRVNDGYGHAAGDEALRRCAAICRAHIREGDVVARIGGEEFAILLKDVDQEEALVMVDRLRHAMAATPVRFGRARFRVTLSGGVCHSSVAPADFEAMLRLADACLYDAKNKGRNRIERIAA